jgi:hypothetical protein
VSSSAMTWWISQRRSENAAWRMPMDLRARPDETTEKGDAVSPRT